MDSIPVVSTILGLIAATSWGAADFFAAKASKRHDPESAALWVSIIGTLTYIVFFLFSRGNLHWTFSGILFAIAAGVALEVGLLMFFRGLDAGPVSIVSPISGAYPLISMLIVLLVFGGSLRPLDIIGILIVVSGIVTASGLLGSKQSERRLTRGVFYGLMTCLLWGIAYAMQGRAVSSIGWQKAVLIDICSGLVTLSVILVLTSGRKLVKTLKGNYFKDQYIVGAALIQLFGGIIFSIGLAHARSSAVIIAVAASYPAFTVFLALKYLGEKKQLVPIAGAFVTIVGVVVLSV